MLATISLLIACNAQLQPKPITEEIRVYFTSTQNNPNLEDCSKVEAVIREVPKTYDTLKTAKLAIAQIFKGPTEEELTAGLKKYWIDDAELLREIKTENQTIYLNWKNIENLIPNASSSCGSQTFLNPLEATLTQFSQIKSVVHAIEGDPKAFYDWLQIGCPENIADSYCDPAPFENL